MYLNKKFTIALPKGRILDLVVPILSKIGIEPEETFFDDKNNIPREVKILGLPVTLLINKKGLEVARLIGPTEWTDKKILEIIRKEISN